MKFTETRILTADQLRTVCINHNWYTCGNSTAYENLFTRLYDEFGTYDNMTTAKLAEIAADIMEHSDIRDYTITTVMYVLAKACDSIFEAA